MRVSISAIRSACRVFASWCGGVPWQSQMGFPANAIEPRICVACVFRDALADRLSLDRTRPSAMPFVCAFCISRGQIRPVYQCVAETRGEFVVVVQLGGLEPPTSCSTDRRSNQLSYNCIASRPPKRGSRTGRKLGATPVFGKAGCTSTSASTHRQKQKARAHRSGFFKANTRCIKRPA